MTSDVDLNLFNSLIVVAEVKNLKKAGLVLNLSESAVSKHISRLSNQLGYELFTRVLGQLEPTEYTKSIVPKIIPILRSLDLALTPTKFDNSLYKEPINLVLPEILLDSYGVQLYESLHIKFPMSKISLHRWNSDTEEKLISSKYDLGIHVLNKDRTSAIYQKVILHDQLSVVVADKYKHYNWEKVKKWKFIQYNVIGWNESKFHFLEEIKKLGVDLDCSYCVDSISILKNISIDNKVALAWPDSIMRDYYCRVSGSEPITYGIDWAVNVRAANRNSPISKVLFDLVKDVISN